MKKIRVITFLVFKALTFAITSAQPSNEEIKSLILTIRQKTEDGPAKSFPDPQMDITGEFMPLPEFQQLRTIAKGHWQVLLNNIATIAPDKRSRVILFHAFEDLTPEDYLSFANQSLIMLQNKFIREDEFLYIVLMPSSKKRWFLSYNFENPGVIDFLNRVRSHFSDNKDIPSLVDFILSGEARERDEILRRENRFFAGQTVDLLSGSSMTTLSPKTTLSQAVATATQPLSTQQPTDRVAPTAIVEAKESPTSFPIVVTVILVFVIAASAVFFLQRKRS